MNEIIYHGKHLHLKHHCFEKDKSIAPSSIVFTSCYKSDVNTPLLIQTFMSTTVYVILIAGNCGMFGKNKHDWGKVSTPD
jgi:hypothetical protein